MILHTKKDKNFPSHACLTKRSDKKGKTFALTQIFIDISEFGIFNVPPLSGRAKYKVFKDERSKNNVLQFLII